VALDCRIEPGNDGSRVIAQDASVPYSISPLSL
jgi:hypothetical protein